VVRQSSIVITNQSVESHDSNPQSKGWSILLSELFLQSDDPASLQRLR